MLLECLIKRDGPTTVVLEKVKYIFMPLPGHKPGTMTTSICDVNTDRHVAHLLKTGQFREYVQPKGGKEIKETVNPLKGFSIEKYFDSGYVVVDQRKKTVKYSGADGIWRNEKAGLKPFSAEMEAYDWLRDEVASLGDGAEEGEDAGDDLRKITERLTKKGNK